jgi:hypothetical protein
VEKDAAELVTLQTMSIIKTGYGKQAVKAKHVSADALAHPLVQLANARLLCSRGWNFLEAAGGDVRECDDASVLQASRAARRWSG